MQQAYNCIYYNVLVIIVIAMKLSHIVHWLLLSSLLAIVASCSNMSSVRNGKYIVAKSEKKQQIKNVAENSDNNTNELESVAQNETYLPDDEKPAQTESNVAVKKIPTLQEQLDRLNNRQDSFDKRIDRLEEQNENITTKLDNLAELITDKNDVSATTGEAKPKAKKKKEAFVLYPDEVVEKKKKPKPKIETRKQSKTTVIEPDKVDSGIFKEASDLVDNKEYSKAILQLLKEEQKIKDKNKLAECRYLLGKSFLNMNRYNQAEDYFDKVLKSNIDYEKKAEAHASKAKIYLHKGNKKEAKESYKTIIEKYATTPYVIEAKKMLQRL